MSGEVIRFGGAGSEGEEGKLWSEGGFQHPDSPVTQGRGGLRSGV